MLCIKCVVLISPAMLAMFIVAFLSVLCKLCAMGALTLQAYPRNRVPSTAHVWAHNLHMMHRYVRQEKETTTVNSISSYKTLSQASPEIVAVPDMTGTAGAIVWWRLRGGLDLEHMSSAWVAAGLDERLLPEYPTRQTALLRAVCSLADKRLLARPMEGTKGWALVREVAEGEGLDYEVLVRARVVKEELKAEVSPQTPQLAEKLRSAYDRFRHELTLNDVSGWMSKLIRTTQAVALRDTGGVYFVPRTHVETYRKIAGVIHIASAHRLFEVPALRSNEAVEAILDAVAREAESEIEAMETELDTENLGGRALHTRQRRCESMREKVRLYEELLDRNLESLHQRMEGLEASITTAILAPVPIEE